MSYDSVLVWMLSLNREYARNEYDTAFQLVKLCFPNEKIKYEPTVADSFRGLMTQLLPVLMMRHRRVPRAKWIDHVTPNNKHWIEHASSSSSSSTDPNDPNSQAGQARARPPSIGYQLTFHNSLCGMAVTQGSPQQVVNIGLGIKQLKVDPKGVSVKTYVESMSHKLTQLELSSILTASTPPEVTLKRLCILLSLKEAYIKAIGQPLGFDFSRLEFDVPNERVSGDGRELGGWEFRVFGAKLGVARGGGMREEEYQCVCAYYRGTNGSEPRPGGAGGGATGGANGGTGGGCTFVFHDTPQALENWVQFINIDQLMAVSAKLAA